METVKDFLKRNNKCVMELIMFYENSGERPKEVYRVLTCAVYSLIDKYVCIDSL